MADPVSQISNENSVSREEALYYLEGSNWDLNLAMEACRNKTLPPLTEQEVSINVNTSPDSPPLPPPPPPSPPTTVDTVRIPNLTINPQRLQEPVPVSSEVRNERILKFLEIAPGATPDEAVFYLTQHEWRADQAIEQYFDDRLSGRYRSYQPQRGNNLGDASASSSSSGSRAFDPTEVVNAADQALMISSQANVMGTNREPLLPMVIGPRASEKQSQSNDELIDSFLVVLGEDANREIAIECLNLHGWDLRVALDNFYKGMEIGLPSDSQLQDSLGYTELGTGGGNSSSVNADATNTGGTFDETGLVDTPIADSGTATFDLANWNADEDPSTETGPEPLATQNAEPITRAITFRVILVDNGKETEVPLTFRSDQTVRDIHDRINALGADYNRNYYLMSETEKYENMDTTVQKIHSHGAAYLKQVER